jgi:hypothetical protein
MPSSSGLPDLQYLKNQAKALLKAFRASDPQARRRVEAHLPRFVRPLPSLQSRRAFMLADALHIIARESGFSSWMKLKSHREKLGLEHVAGPGGDHSPDHVDTRENGPFSGLARSLNEQANNLVDLAARMDSAGLAWHFSRMPRRDILAVRTLLVERGHHLVLVEGLLQGLQHAHPKVRYECAHALDHLADERCVEPLRRLLDDPTPRVRRMALHALSCEVCKLTPLQVEENLVTRVIEHALSDPSINVRRHAAMALGNFCADPRAGLTLQMLLDQESDATLLREAYRALRRCQGAPGDGTKQDRFSQ